MIDPVRIWFLSEDQAIQEFHEIRNNKPSCVRDAEEVLRQAPCSPPRKKKLKAANEKWDMKRLVISMSIIEQFCTGQERRESHRVHIRMLGDIRSNREKGMSKKTPKWFGEFDKFVIDELKSLRTLRYESTGIEWHIDHMYPLGAKMATGLHCGLNLQLIPAALNLKKNELLKYTEPFQWLEDLHLVSSLAQCSPTTVAKIRDNQ